MSVTAPGGFSASGVHCGIKSDGALDLALVRSEVPSVAAAVFTNSTTAAPAVDQGRQVVSDGVLQAFVIASGCANAGTGSAGRAAVDRVATSGARTMGVDEGHVLVSTTGPIGPVLPDQLVTRGIVAGQAELASTPASGTAAARGILTTDTITKQAISTGDGFTMGAMAKGSGMVRPDMATMLAFVTTDAVVNHGVLRSALRTAVDLTFNCLNIDGCQSTNDTVAIMASGLSEVEPSPDVFEAALTALCRDLVGQMARDAEGATRVVTIEVSGAETTEDAREIGKSVADASLVRASFYGGDPNWGRLFAAAGASGRPIHSDSIAITYEEVPVAVGGVGVPYDEAPLLDRLAKGDFTVGLIVGTGPGRSTIVTTDLTPEYVVFNGERS